jgi:hypothetical protein
MKANKMRIKLCILNKQKYHSSIFELAQSKKQQKNIGQSQKRVNNRAENVSRKNSRGKVNLHM